MNEGGGNLISWNGALNDKTFGSILNTEVCLPSLSFLKMESTESPIILKKPSQFILKSFGKMIPKPQMNSMDPEKSQDAIRISNNCVGEY